MSTRSWTGGRDTIGLRVPAHPVAQELLVAFSGGIAAPSANRFGHVSPTTAAHVRADLGDDVDLVLDGGPSQVGVESTIVDLTGRPRRSSSGPESVPAAALAEGVLGVAAVGPGRPDPVSAPGMLASYNAPRAAIELVDDPADGPGPVRGAGRDAACGSSSSTPVPTPSPSPTTCTGGSGTRTGEARRRRAGRRAAAAGWRRRRGAGPARQGRHAPRR